MGTISTGVGLISGLPIQDIINQLMAIERRPVDLLQARLQEVTAERTALTDLSARLTALKGALTPLKNSSFFRTMIASSSDESVVRVSASEGARPGTHRLAVYQLATAQQLVSRGLADPDRTPIGVGTMVVTSASAKLSRPTSLQFLNSQRGVGRGTIQITDGSGASAVIDLTQAITLQDVLDEINTATGIHVRAEVQGDRIVLTDLSGAQSSSLTVTDLYGGTTAEDLGIAGSASSSGTEPAQILGRDINTIDESTWLAVLNDGAGVRRSGREDLQITAADGTTFTVSLADVIQPNADLAMLNSGLGVRLGTIRITDAVGTETEIDLSGAQTIQDVIDAINAGAEVSVLLAGNKLVISDGTGGDKSLIIEDVTGHAAADLGIAGRVDAVAKTDDQGKTYYEAKIIGEEFYQVRTIGDVLRAINYAEGNNGAVTASFDATGKWIVLTDNTTGGGTLTVQAATDDQGNALSQALVDLGLDGQAAGGVLTGRRLIPTLDTTLLRSLNGGRGIGELGQIRIVDRAGGESVVDLSGALTVADVLDAINSSGGAAQVQAELSDSGLGIVIRDVSGGTGTLLIEDVSGTAAADLKIAGQTSQDRLGGGVLYKQIVSENSLLAALNAGNGVAKGQFRITNSNGASAVIDLTGDDVVTIKDVIDKINEKQIDVHAALNDTGDGIVIVDTAGGDLPLKIEDIDSTTAADLHIAGQARQGEDRIDGRISVEVEVGAGDGLNDLVERLAAADHLLEATLINDGSGVAPYRLFITAEQTGRLGELAIDSPGLSLGLSTLVRAQDAMVSLGGSGDHPGLAISSSSNHLTDVIAGVDLTLVGRSQSPVDVSISEDVDKIAEQLGRFAERFSETIDRINELTDYDAETEQRGILMGDITTERVRSRLYDMIRRSVSTAGAYRTLMDIGFKVGSGATLEFDEEVFRRAYQTDPDSVEQLLAGENGLAGKLEQILDDIVDSHEGLLSVREQTLLDREDLYQQRIEDLNDLLDAKERQLYSQFQAMEAALSQLQAQQAALASFMVIPPMSVGLGSQSQK